MNVMKQDAMDNKIIERCKTCVKQISQQEKNVKHIDLKTHTHTLNKSNQFLYFKNNSRQFSDHTLTHVNLVGQITLYLHMYQE